MASYDSISKMDIQEVRNVVNMAQKQIASRYDFKGSNTSIEMKGEETIELNAPDDYKIKAALDVLRTNMAKRNVGMKSVEVGDIKPSGNQRLKQVLILKSGIDKEAGKKINKAIKESGLKVTSAYLDEKVRVTGKKIDELQDVYAMLRANDDIKLDLQMENMKR